MRGEGRTILHEPAYGSLLSVHTGDMGNTRTETWVTRIGLMSPGPWPGARGVRFSVSPFEKTHIHIAQDRTLAVVPPGCWPET